MSGSWLWDALTFFVTVFLILSVISLVTAGIAALWRWVMDGRWR